MAIAFSCRRLSGSRFFSAGPFCELAAERVIKRGDVCLALADGYPVSPGHTLIIA
jgi:diadenosine tetraphosphate (Ap4A) HIT family hydrolase